MRAAPRLSFALACLLAIAALVAGCGGDSDSSTSGGGAGSAESRPAPAKSEVPSAPGKSLSQVLKLADGPAELVVSPAAMVFYEGENRFPFGVFERDRSQIADAEVALYFAKVPTPSGKQSKAGGKG